MLQWKQRLYAFLLRRLLGPFLDDAAKKLHECIDEISLQDGRFCLRDVSLNASYITNLCKNNISIRSVTIAKLEIQMSLKEQEENNDETTTSSLAWRAVKLGNSSPSVSLVVHIEIEGVRVELEPGVVVVPQEKEEKPPEQQQNKSMMASYVDSALSSLRLSIEMKDIRVRTFNSETTDWVELVVPWASYHDVNSSQQKNSQEDHEMVLHKAVDFRGVFVQAGGCNDVTTTIARAEGTGQVCIRVIQYKQTQAPRITQDVEVKLAQRVNIAVDAESLRRIHSVALGFVEKPQKEEQPQQIDMETAADDDNASSDVSTIHDILKQYQEARNLAERNELRGGILVPSFDESSSQGDDDNNNVTFDAFFDANDKSFYHYSSVVHESTSKGDNNGVDTCIKFHLVEGSVKLIFCRPEEYLLLRLYDLNTSSSVSYQKTEHTVSILHIDIEDSQVDPIVADRQVSRIGTVLRFSPMDSEPDTITDGAIVSQAPCITLHSTTTRESKMKKSTRIDLHIEPVELFYRHGTMTNLSVLLALLKSRPEATGRGDGASKGESSCTHFACSCPSVSLAIPVLDNSFDTTRLYRRAGYFVDGSHVGAPYIGVVLDQLGLEHSSGDNEGPITTVTCCHVVVSASSPTGDGPIQRKQHRIDLLAIAGRMEVEPYIPVTFKLRHNTGQDNTESAFPTVPELSSFKARQEDDEDSNLYKVVSDEVRNMAGDARKPMRTADQQRAMREDAEKCRTVIEIHAPELVCDVSVGEASAVMNMLERTVPRSDKSEASPKTGSDAVGIAVKFDQITLSLQKYLPLVPSTNSKPEFVYMLILDGCNSHVLLKGGKLKHARLLVQDPGLCELTSIAEHTAVVPNPANVEDRFKALSARGSRSPRVSCIPLFFRSRLFQPISPESPSLSLDLVVPDGKMYKCKRQNIHITVYHMTYRYDVDSEWMRRLREMLVPRADGGASSDQTTPGKPAVTASPSSSLTRMFLSFTDCNFDYSSPARFKTASRLILRVGDLRGSSNILSPTPALQAFSISLGDLSLYLRNSRHTYNDENAVLSRITHLMHPSQTTASSRLKWLDSSMTPETLLRGMNFVDILSLDSMDSLISISGAQGPQSEPSVTTSLTFGQVTLFACKDSFKCFADSVGELQIKLTALTDSELASRKPNDSELASKDQDERRKGGHLCSEKTQVETTNETFLLDGYDWMTVEQDSCSAVDVPAGEEQVARWYSPSELPAKSADPVTHRIGILAGHGEQGNRHQNISSHHPPRIISHHFPIHPVSNPLGEGDMNAAKYAGTRHAPPVKTRILIHDLSLKLRFFDGYDWPESLSTKSRKARRGADFVIEELVDETNEQDAQANTLGQSDNSGAQRSVRNTELMGNLLNGADEEQDTFKNLPLPEERGARLNYEAEIRRLVRRSGRFFQVSLTGLSLRLDSFHDSKEHRLVSVMDLAVKDLFLAETISDLNPVKMVGEWVNEVLHPRDTNQGLLIMRMVTWHPDHFVTAEGEIANDECEVTLQLLPLRCIIDQNAIRFARSFFSSAAEEAPEEDWTTGLHLVPAPLFRLFCIEPCKLKVDYRPRKMDVSSLKDGSLVELINISPLDAMVLTLEQVNVRREIGFGAAFGVVFRCWLRDICATQMHKFLANARPFEPLTSVGNGVLDLFVLPYEAYKNGDDVQKALKSGVFSLAGTLAYETLSTTSRLTQYAASSMAEAVHASNSPRRMHGSPLPSRPSEMPKGISDVRGHAFESLAHGIHTANYKVVIVPYREYVRVGAKGAVKSILKGIPVAVVAPLSGATEALSYTLLGARNQIRPDIRKEEEASQRGLKYEF